MKNIFNIVLIAILLFAIGCSKDSPNEPDTDLKILIDPAEQNISIDSETEFNVKIENVSSLFAISVEITFDETLLSVPDNAVSVGDFWNSAAITAYVVESNRLNIAIGLTQTDDADGVSGNGTLFSFKLKGNNTGISDISLQNLQLIDENGTQVSNFDGIIISNGSLEITE